MAPGRNVSARAPGSATIVEEPHAHNAPASGSCTPSGDRCGRSLQGERPARPESVTEIRHLVCDVARKHDLEGLVIERVALAVTEAAANVVMHAYEEGSDGVIQFTVTLDDAGLEIAIRDQGRGLHHASTRPGAGFGLRLIQQTSSDFELRDRHPAGVELRMRFAAEPAALDD